MDEGMRAEMPPPFQEHSSSRVAGRVPAEMPPPYQQVVTEDELRKAIIDRIIKLEGSVRCQGMQIPKIIECRKNKDMEQYKSGLRELKQKSKGLGREVNQRTVELYLERRTGSSTELDVFRKEGSLSMLERAKMNLDIAIAVLESGNDGDRDDLADIWCSSAEGKPRLEESIKLGLEVAKRGSRRHERLQDRFERLKWVIGENSRQLMQSRIKIAKEKLGSLMDESRETVSRLTRSSKASRKQVQGPSRVHGNR